MYTLRVLGGLGLERDGTPLDDTAGHRKPLALLAILAVDGIVTRDRLMALLWPDKDMERARGSLKQAIHLLRHHLQAPDLLSGTSDLRLAPQRIDSDVRRFLHALESGDPGAAVRSYGGALLDGVHVGGTELQSWVDARGSELGRRYREALETLAREAEAAGDLAAAADWWRRLQSEDPANGRVAVRLMRALEASGQRAAALRHARVHEVLLREQWDLEPDPAVMALAEELRRSNASPAAVPAAAAAPAVDVGVPPGGIPDPTTGSAPEAAPRWRDRAGSARVVVGAGLLLLVFGGAIWQSGQIRALGSTPTPPDDPLTDLLAPPLVTEERTIAVLPFVDMSPDGDHGHLSDGLTVELSSRLARIDGLRVAARTSAFQFKGTSPDAREVGERLGVATVLEGSVRRAGDRLRITAELVDARSGYRMWGETYESGLGDLFAIQDGIGQAVASALRLRLAAAPASVRLTETEAAAYDLYLRGRYFLRQHTPEATRLAGEAFRQALRLDPTLAKAYSGLADIEMNPSVAAPAERFRRAKVATERALALDSLLAEAHASRAWIAMWYDRDWATAERHFRRAIEIDPSYTQAYNWYGAYLGAIGRLEESLTVLRRVHELAPSPANASFVAARFLWLDRPEEAIDYFRSALALDSTLFLARWGLGRSYLALGRHEEAIREFRYPGADFMGVFQAGHLGYAYASAGMEVEARQVLGELRARIDRGEYVAPTDMAIIHIGLGEREEALDWLERHEADRGARIFLKVDPLFDPLRAEPRFERLLARLGL